jgi:hypothetical protein
MRTQYPFRRSPDGLCAWNVHHLVREVPWSNSVCAALEGGTKNLRLHTFVCQPVRPLGKQLASNVRVPCRCSLIRTVGLLRRKPAYRI